MPAIIAPRGRGEEGMSESHLRKLPAKNAGVDFDGADGDRKCWWCVTCPGAPAILGGGLSL